MTTPYIEYGYANGSANTVRPTELTYPDGREIALDYGSAGSMADALSRVASLIDDDNTHLADYSYLGERSFVVADSPQPDVKWTLASLTGTNDPDTGDIYSGLDRFGRVKDNRWYDYGSSADADRIKYGYDRAGNRTWRQNTVADALGARFDEFYRNDLIHRLKELSRGTLNAQKTNVTNDTFGECWSLDPTGNWKKYLEDANGDGTWNLEQSRTANTVNEITGISETVGPSWVTPAYNAAGNMTTVPQPAEPTKSFTATYDAWNRLVKLVDDDTDDTVAEYQYDGANRRIVQKSYVGGDLDETRHLYYTQPSQWQVVEERVDADTDPERQFVWGLRYIDDLILRDRDTNGDGSLNERLYALQDANWNLTGLIDTAGDVQERCAYSAYGTPLFLTPSFGGRVSSSFDWETLYAGYRWETLTELLHVRHRVLNSALGTWCQRDPIHFSDGPSLYQYVTSAPLLRHDPFGMSGEICGFFDEDSCIGAALSCLCGLIGLVDAFVPMPPQLAAIVSGLDCLCDMTRVVTVGDCCAYEDPPPWEWVVDFIGGMAGCIIDFAQMSGDLGGLFGRVLDILDTLFDEGTAIPFSHVQSTLCNCADFLSNCDIAYHQTKDWLHGRPIGHYDQNVKCNL